MIRLFMILYTVIATAAAGAGVTVALTMGRVDAASIIVAAVLGALVALPISWVVAKGLAES